MNGSAAGERAERT